MPVQGRDNLGDVVSRDLFRDHSLAMSLSFGALSFFQFLLLGEAMVSEEVTADDIAEVICFLDGLFPPGACVRRIREVAGDGETYR